MMNILSKISRVEQTEYTRYVGRKFAALKNIANDGKPFAIDDGRVNRKKIAKIFI